MTSNFSGELIGKTTLTYAKDVAERTVWTFVTAGAGLLLASGPADMFQASFWQSVGAAGMIAGGTFAKGLLARLVGDPNSASFSRAV